MSTPPAPHDRSTQKPSITPLLPGPEQARLNLLRKENQRLVDLVIRLSRIVATRALEK